MDKKITPALISHLIELRKSVKPSDMAFRIRQSTNLTQLVFFTKGCNNAKSGSCIFCNYGIGKSEPSFDDIDNAFNNLPKNFEKLLLDCLGSFWDKNELSAEKRKYIYSKTQELSLKRLIIETHYQTVNAENLKEFKSYFPNTQLIIEMGLESSNPKVQKECLNKIIDLDKLKKTMDLIHSYGILVDLNVIYGLPFLGLSERKKEFQDTLVWANNNGADNIIVFLMYVPQTTILEELYNQGEYILPIKEEIDIAIAEMPKDIQNKIIFSGTVSQAIKDKNAISAIYKIKK